MANGGGGAATGGAGGGAGAGVGKGQSMLEPVRTWMMVVLTLVFVALYIGALLGLIPGKATVDQQTLTRIESVVFVIIGYYFGRLPAQATEKSLRDEAASKTQKADQAANQAAQAANQAAALTEKVKNAKAAAAAVAPGAPPADGLVANLSKAPASTDALRQSLLAAMNVLES